MMMIPYGFVRVSAATPSVRPGDCRYNRESIRAAMLEAESNGCDLLVLPELCVTGYTCGDLFAQRALLRDAEETVGRLAEDSASCGALVFAGAPVLAGGRLFNCAAALWRGEILGLVPKTWLPNTGEFYEKRLFTSPAEHNPGDTVTLAGRPVPFGVKLLFKHRQYPDFTAAAEICEDLWTPVPPSCAHALAGASVVANLSAGSEGAGKPAYRRSLTVQQSARLLCAYVYAGAGSGESTTDMVFSGHNIIAENGRVLAESVLYENGAVYADADIALLTRERAFTASFVTGGGNAFLDTGGYRTVPFGPREPEVSAPRPPARFISRTPFVPADGAEGDARCDEVLDIQAEGLAQRLRHIGLSEVTLAVSGGLDSTLALLAAVRTFDKLGLNRTGIHAVSMPCFGTSSRTRGNAQKLAEAAGVTFREIDIRASVQAHFTAIGHPPGQYDVVYENAQARERTQVVMDLGFMLGTGDLSELALGFSTYNGDHMSMYNVNASVPKTLIRHLIRRAAESAPPAMRAVLTDILDTPVSPELLPPDPATGRLTQVTESIVGPYELHDFFLYYTLRYGFPPEKVLFLAEAAFTDYTRNTIKSWLVLFYQRFFANQFKRSCAPDGPMTGPVSLSPRGCWRMPSDASAAAWTAAAERA